MSVSSEAEDTAIDLRALDDALSPLRRVVAYSQRGPVQYLGVIGSLWLDKARATNPPEAAVTLLDEMAEALSGYDDSADSEDRRDVLASALARIDALLGLPLRPLRRKKRRGSGGRGKGTSDRRDTKSSSRGSGKGRGRGRGRGRGGARKDDAAESAFEAGSNRESRSEPRSSNTDRGALRLGDDAFAGPIAGLTFPSGEHGAVGRWLGAFEAAGLNTVADLVMLAPVGEDVVQPVLGAGRLTEAGRVAVGGRVRSRKTVASADGTVETVVKLRGAGVTVVRWKGGAPSWMTALLEPEQRVVLVGQAVEVDEGVFELHDAELGTDDGKHAVRLATYGVDGVDDAVIRGLVRQSMGSIRLLQEPLVGAFAQSPQLAEAIVQGHTMGKRATAARSRLSYDEALLVQLAAFWERFNGASDRGLAHTLLHGLSSRMLRRVDVELSDEQQAAFEEVKRDLRASRPMRRVLTGEVGGGKGLVVLLSTALVAENKHQVLIIAPDQATAEQRYAFTEPLLRDLGLVSRLYVEDPSGAQRDAIRRGEVHVLFGTSDLLKADIEYRRLGLVVAGERDQFGGIQPLVAALKSPAPDVLIVTSTPVSSPVLLAAYPTYDHTILRNFPGQPVPAHVVTADERQKAYSAAAEAVEQGQQAVVVFPMSRGADVLDVREALRILSTLEQSVFPGKRVKLFHGAMSREERYRTYTDFRDHRIDVLMATTHFEAGPTVPKASVVIIEQADRMLLSRLHRVRGHLSVGRYPPTCWLITGEEPDEAGLQRVQRFAKSADGFSVSLQELDARGLDDMLVGEPAPSPNVRWLDPRQDLDTLAKARADARAILISDSSLRRPSNVELARYLRARWGPMVGGDCPVQVSAASGSRRRRRRRKR
ncbi:MAG: helicase-related protein [Myxococcota bacterium]